MANLQVEADGSVRQVALTRDCVTIGRLPTNDVVIPRQQISRHHAELRSTADGWWISDLESKNGLEVDGVRVRRHLLREHERVQLAPGVSIALLPTTLYDDVALRPTTFIPALSVPTREPGEAAAAGWRPSASATSWGASVVSTPPTHASSDPSASLEGDLFRRRRSRISGGPSADATRSGSRPAFGAAASYLHLCQTCGQQTAPDCAQCQACGSPIARACGGCALGILPVQDLCPRCQTPNPASVLRARRTATSA